jgi:hypothetical protein
MRDRSSSFNPEEITFQQAIIFKALRMVPISQVG